MLHWSLNANSGILSSEFAAGEQLSECSEIIVRSEQVLQIASGWSLNWGGGVVGELRYGGIHSRTRVRECIPPHQKLLLYMHVTVWCRKTNVWHWSSTSPTWQESRENVWCCLMYCALVTAPWRYPISSWLQSTKRFAVIVTRMSTVCRIYALRR